MISQTLGFLGYGNMGAAIAEGLIGLNAVEAGGVLAFDPSSERMAAAARAGVAAFDSVGGLVGASDALVLAVKPQIMAKALEEVKPHLQPDTLVISIAAGISIKRIQAGLNAGTPVIRVMPNTPYLVHAGAAGIAASPECRLSLGECALCRVAIIPRGAGPPRGPRTGNAVALGPQRVERVL